MFKFKNLTKSEPEEEIFNPEEFKVTFADFLETRRTSIRPYVFDLRTAEEFDESHIMAAYSLPMEHFEDAIYQMPYEGDILLYGSGNEEGRKAAEILYENGFDTFSYIDDYQELLAFLSQSEFTITDSARTHIQKCLKESDPPLKGFRILAKPISPKKARYSTDFVKADDDVSKDQKLSMGTFDVYVDTDSLFFLSDTSVDYDESAEEGLKISNPEREIAPIADGSEMEMMQQLLDEQINPMVASHGGVVELIEIKDNRVYLEFGGGCKGCGMVNVTLKQGVEVVVKENIPGIEEILDVTDHANGTNPYYQPGK
ncbi:MAG: NifU family protein [SAR324 cluster bacterium]|nr:NifU family protein [SAR324 cluster bacterium]